MTKKAFLLGFSILWSFSGLSSAEEKIGDCLARYQKDTPGIFKVWVDRKHHQSGWIASPVTKAMKNLFSKIMD